MLQKHRFNNTIFLSILLFPFLAIAQQTPISGGSGGGSGGDASAENQLTEISKLDGISNNQSTTNTRLQSLIDAQGTANTRLQDISDTQYGIISQLSSVSSAVSGINTRIDASAIHNNTKSVTPKFSAIDASNSGDNTLVSAVPGKKIRVYAANIVCEGETKIQFESGAGGTALTGQISAGSILYPFSPFGWFETEANALLNLEISDAVSCAGSLVYGEV